MALVAMAIAAARPHRQVVHRLPGRGDHRLRARQGEDHRHHAGPDRAGDRRRRDRDRRRLPGRLPGHQGHHHAGPRRLRHHRCRAGRRAGRRGLRDLLRRRRCLHRRPAHRAHRPQARPHLRRGDAGDGGVGRQDPAPAVRRVRAPLPDAGPRPLLLLPEGRHLDRPRLRGRRTRGTGHHRRSRPRPERGQGHRGRRTGQGRRGRPDLRGAGLGRGQPRHGRPERLGRRDRPHRHLVHAAPCRRQHRDGRAGQDPGRGRLREAALRRPDRQGLADRRRHALAPGHHRQVLLRAGRGRGEHRDDLHLRDPHLGDRGRGVRSTTPSAPPTPPSTSTPTRSRPSSTEGPADEHPHLQHRRRRRHRPGRRRDAPDPGRARLPGRRHPVLRLRALGRHRAAVRRAGGGRASPSRTPPRPTRAASTSRCSPRVRPPRARSRRSTPTPESSSSTTPAPSARTRTSRWWSRR